MSISTNIHRPYYVFACTPCILSISCTGLVACIQQLIYALFWSLNLDSNSEIDVERNKDLEGRCREKTKFIVCMLEATN